MLQKFKLSDFEKSSEFDKSACRLYEMHGK